MFVDQVSVGSSEPMAFPVSRVQSCEPALPKGEHMCKVHRPERVGVGVSWLVGAAAAFVA